MSGHGAGRKLPPLSPKAATNTNEEPTYKKKKAPKKKRQETEDEGVGEMTTIDRDVSSSRRSLPKTDDETSPRNKTPRSRSRSGSTPRKRSSSRTSVRENQENVGPTEQKSKTKKKKKKTVTASSEALISGEEALTDRSHGKKKKKKKKKRKTVTSETEEDEADIEVGLAAELGDLKDDIVEAEKADEEAREDTMWAQPAMKSEAFNKMFIEQKSGFKTTDKHKLARQRLADEARSRSQLPTTTSQTTIQLALASHRGFKTFTIFLQGLFAGLALWQIVGVYLLSNRGFDIFLEYYYEVALPVQSTYFFLFALCLVSAFDRYDIGRPTHRLLQRAFTLQSGAVACLFYFTGLVISTAIAATDDKIGLYKVDDTLWQDAQARDSELSTWRILNLVRGLCPIIGWFIISLKPSTDRLSKNLQKADENLLVEQQIYQQNLQTTILDQSSYPV